MRYMLRLSFFGLSVLIASGEGSAQPTLRIVPATTTVLTAQACTLRVQIENVANLGAFQFDLIFDSHVVHATTAWAGPFLGSTGRTVIPVGPQIDNTSYPGRLTFGAATFGVNPGPNGSGALAQVVFLPQAEGSTGVDFQNVLLADINGNSLPVGPVIGGALEVHTVSPLLVTTTADSGLGSLRDAVNYANSHEGPDTIRFLIPAVDPRCDSLGVCTIPLTQSLALHDSGTVIDGYTQPGAYPNTNPFGESINAVLKVVVDGCAQQPVGIRIYSADNVVRGLVISRFDRAIEFFGPRARRNRIEGNFIGTDATGTVARGNRTTGIAIGTYASENIVGGTDPNARNLISGNSSAVEIGPWGRNLIQGNYIGTDVTGLAPLGNTVGVRIVNVSQNNLIGGSETGAQNLIAFNGTGILVDGSFGEAYYNTFSRNSIHSNAVKGISLVSGGNQSIPAPAITSAAPTQVVGTAGALAKVEVFSDADGQGALYEGSAMADASGGWVLSKPEGFAGPYLTAAATDPSGNTSEFSAPVATAVGTRQTDAPSCFALYPAYPNPFNASTLVRYDLPQPAHVLLVVYNPVGQMVRQLVDEFQLAGSYCALWDGTSHLGLPVPSGVYICALSAGGAQAITKAVLAR
ncbi:MAG: hypothetical protein ONB30_06120 [candidate division KSB1 bacterium]|nr:hypothetical protein [candidate division KSB1 bacterium]